MQNREREPVIEVSRLNSYYGERQVLFDLTFPVHRNKISVIMGVSGCGKSTLLRHLIGLKETEFGDILIEGNSLKHFNRSQLAEYRKRIGVLFQGGALFNSLTVRENIAVPLRVHTRLAEETIRIVSMIKLHQVGLSQFAHYMPSQLSGGMRKRAGLARALAMDPEILLVDEPSSGLDPITAAGLDQLITNLRDALGMTVIVVTHELESAFRIADQLLVIDQGALLALGTSEEIQQSREPRVRQFLNRQAEPRRTEDEDYANILLGSL